MSAFPFLSRMQIWFGRVPPPDCHRPVSEASALAASTGAPACCAPPVPPPLILAPDCELPDAPQPATRARMMSDLFMTISRRTG